MRNGIQMQVLAPVSLKRIAEQAITLTPDDYRGYLARGRVRLEREAEGALPDLEKAAALSQRKARCKRAGREKDQTAEQS